VSINTKRVQGRRSVRYASFDELLADARRLAASEPRALGNWSQGQIYDHLARSMNASIDGAGFSIAAPLRWIASRFLKRRFLERGLPAGFKAPPRAKKYMPGETSTPDGLAALEAAIDRLGHETTRMPHPAFGEMTREEWDQLHLRHAELHMSFLVTDEG
jgi:hypothetical protein